MNFITFFLFLLMITASPIASPSPSPQASPSEAQPSGSDNEMEEEEEEIEQDGNVQKVPQDPDNPQPATSDESIDKVLQYKKKTPRGNVYCRVGYTTALWQIKEVLVVWVSPTGNALYEKRFHEQMNSEIVKIALPGEEMEEKAAAEVKKNPIVFQCEYCTGTFKKLIYLKNHLFGRVQETSGKNRKRIVNCPRRMIVDKLPYNRNNCPVCLPPPKKKVWAWVYLQDTSLAKPNGDFDIPDHIQKQWDDLFNPSEEKRRGRPKKK